MHRSQTGLSARTNRTSSARPLCAILFGLAFLAIPPTGLVAQQASGDKPTVQELHAHAFPPNQAELPVPAPSDAIVLLGASGTNLFLGKQGGKTDWPLEAGTLVSTRGNRRSNHVVSKLHFRDAEIHVEFALPATTSGNSGVYIHGNYEFQIFNSFGKRELEMGDMGAVYGFAKPRVQAARKPGQWQVVDIRYRAPRRDAGGKIVEQGWLTAWLNGREVQHEMRFGEPRSVYHPYRYRATPYLQAIWKRQKQTQTGPVFLQDHDSPVRFRNIWVRPLDDRAFLYEPKNPEPPLRK